MKLVCLPTLFLSFRALNPALAQTSCSGDKDCSETDNQYCLAGICADIGACNSAFDCSNPANSFVAVDCLGYHTCEEGACGHVCSEFCENDEGCSMNQYCASGVCVPNGNCNSDLDCINPKNDYPSVFCIGYKECNQGFCGQTCSDFCSKNGEKPARCESDACDANPCDSSVSCVKNCADCTAIHFDGSGKQVCLDDSNTVFEEVKEEVKEKVEVEKVIEETTPQPCSSIKDCSDDQYCGHGICLSNGSCQSDMDCMNRENRFPATRCLGYFKCEKASCSNICSETCENGEERMTCGSGGVGVCDVKSCDTSVSCYENCADCTPIYFNAAGEQTCQGLTGSMMRGKADIKLEFEKAKSAVEANVENEEVEVETEAGEVETEAGEVETEAGEVETEAEQDTASLTEDSASPSATLTAWLLSAMSITFYLH